MTGAQDLAAAHGLDATAGTPGAEGAVAASDVEYRFDPQRTCELLADALARLHRVPVDAGAAAHIVRLGPADVVAGADERVASGSLPPPDPAYAHVEPMRLLDSLRTGADAVGCPADDLVLTHGHPTPATLRCRAGQAVGFAGWEGAAVADRHRDLAVAATAVAAELGPMLVPLLFERYGRRPDPLRLDWWALADQLTRNGVA